MLEVEKRYQAPHSAFQKFERIRIEQWVSRTLMIIPIVQEIMLSNIELIMEKESQSFLYVAS